MNTFEENVTAFIDSIESVNTKRVVKSVFGRVNEGFTNYNPVQMEQFILSLNPSSPKAVITYCYIFGLYAKWLYENGIVENDELYRTIRNLDRSLLWKKAKPNASKKFISHTQFEQVVHEIGVYEELNALYYQSLFRCLYEGIYADNLSVIKNLRGSDINKNFVVLREDSGYSYSLEIPYSLAEDLQDLSKIDTWERKNRSGVCHTKATGLYPDSCFKVEKRGRKGNMDTEDLYKFSYYYKLRKISNEYLDHNLLPVQIFVSGIMYRIRNELEKEGFTLEEAFSVHNRNRTVANIIRNELDRCNNNTSVRSFREMVKGHLEVFAQ